MNRPSGSQRALQGAAEKAAVAKAARTELKRRGKTDAEIEAGKTRAGMERPS